MKQLIVRLHRDQVFALFPELKGCQLSRKNEGLSNMALGMFRSGAKLYLTKRPGNYRISGYAADDSDVLKAVSQILQT